MFRHIVTTAISVAVAFGTSAAQQQKPFHAGTELVEIDAVVVDDQGRLVSGLTADDFDISEDGVSVHVATFVPAVLQSAPDEGRLIVLLLDDLIADGMRTVKIKEIGRMFASRMGPRDVMAVTRLNGSATTTSTSRAAALAAIDQFTPAGGTAIGAEGGSDGWKSFHALRAIADLANQLASVKHRRKTLVCVGAATMFNPTEPIGRSGDKGFAGDWFDAVRAAARTNLSVYVLDPAGLTGSQYDGAIGFASETGGVAFVNSNFFTRNVDQIWAEAGHYYLLGYEPPPSKRKGHTIDVKVKRTGTHVRARRARA